MVDVHRNGWRKKVLDAGLREQIQWTMYCTFQERFQGVVNLLSVRD
jgi:hypothetical protein